MTRRGAPGIQVLVLIGVVLISIYGYYSYNELKSALRKSEEIVKRVTLAEENLSTQLQALNEQKNQLEETLKKDKDAAKKEKDELLQVKSGVEMRCKQEKKSSEDEIQSLTSQLEKQKTEYEALRVQQQKQDDLNSEHEAERTRLSDEIKRLRQESSNELAVLNDKVADLKRQNDALRELTKRKLTDSAKHVAPVGLNARKSFDKDNRNVNNLPKADSDYQGKVNDNNIPQLGDGNQNLQDAGKKEEEENRMQIRGPDEDKKQAYFEPREAKPDHPIGSVRTDTSDHEPVKNDLRFPDAEQVAPPKVDDSKELKPKRHFEEHESDRLKRGANVRTVAADNFGRPMNPMMPVGVEKFERRHEAAFPDAKKGPKESILRRLNPVDGRDVGNRGDQVENPMAIAEPHLRQDEENQLQGPGMNEQNESENEKDEGADNGDENDEDYQYEEGKKDRARMRDAVNGPHAAPVEEEEEEEKDAGLL